MIDIKTLNVDLIKLRQDIHHDPELSGMEQKTAAKLIKALKMFSPDGIITDLGGHGIAAVFDSKLPGSTIMFRAELDALPIAESNKFSYCSKIPDVSHKCGHDGHMAILIGLAEKLSEKKFSGKIILLFQPAEETAQGAKSVLEDAKFKQLDPNYIFALHNLPGYETGSIIIKNECFTSTSIGLIINLLGETSHAGHPEDGNNPAPAMIEIIRQLLQIPDQIPDYSLVTMIYTKLGEIAFGTSAGQAVIMATFRSYNKEILQKMQQKATDLVQQIATSQNLDHSIEWVEYFPEIINNSECVTFIEKAANSVKKKIIHKSDPFAWTEDFSYFTQKIKGAFFGLGAGKDHYQLHHFSYDFPDEIINDGVEIFYQIIKEINKENP